uniref:Uncharacterized protein n=1 Tax=Oryza nivara TaxID=4536 RepID=A0A0E0ICL9_ORYNI
MRHSSRWRRLDPRRAGGHALGLSKKLGARKLLELDSIIKRNKDTNRGRVRLTVQAVKTRFGREAPAVSLVCPRGAAKANK